MFVPCLCGLVASRGEEGTENKVPWGPPQAPTTPSQTTILICYLIYLLDFA